MSDSDFDFGETLVAKSDQLNADDLVGGPITVQITGHGSRARPRAASSPPAWAAPIPAR
jgi:hypothetical protein